MNVISRFFLLAAALCLPAKTQTVRTDPPIQKLADIRNMTVANASKSFPVSVAGIVTWCSPKRVEGGFMIDQDGKGIFVMTDQHQINGDGSKVLSMIQQLKPGDRLQITGVTQSGRYAPQIFAKSITKLGQGAIPKGKEMGLGYLLTGKYDAQRVALKGVVTRCHRADDDSNSWIMILAGASGKARAVVPALPRMLPGDIEDSGVLIRGVVFTRCNSRHEFTGISIETNQIEDVKIYRQPSRDPFGVEMLEPGRLKAYVPKGYSQHRRRVRGIVTLAKPGMLYLQGPSGGSRISTRTNEVHHSVGDVIEAAGFVEPYLGTSELASSLTRKTATGQVPLPIDISIADKAEMANVEGMLTRMRGTVLESHQSTHGIETVLSENGKSYRAILINPPTHTKPLIPGSQVEITGVAEISYDSESYFPDLVEVSGLRILLRSPDDIVIINTPSWWTTRRLLIALSMSLAFVALLGGSALLLMRRVRSQSHQLAAEALAHQQVTAAHNAMMEERARLAGEMHDGLQPMLSGLAFYLDAADSKLQRTLTSNSIEALQKSRDLLTRIREEFRQCIWCLYELGRQKGDLENELLRLARVQQQWSHATVHTEIIGHPFPIPQSMTRGLLLTCQEAVENASRHGKAKRIKIQCNFSPSGITLTITDDGCGFDIDLAKSAMEHHYGISNMKQRIEKLGGFLSVESHPHQETRVEIRITYECIERIANNPLISKS